MTILRATYDKLALALLICAAAHGATTSTTLTVTGTGTLNFTTESATVTGTATLTGIGNGTFNATVSLTSISGANVNVPFTITLPAGTSNTLTGTLVVPVALLTGSATSGSGSATITGGTGSFSGDTGSFPSLTGTGSLNSTTFAITFSFTGPGSITTGGGGTTTPTPTISLVADSASYSTNIAQGSLFIVKGSNLSPSGFIQLSYPLLPTTSNGVTVTFTPAAGGSGTPAYLVYLLNQPSVNQLAAVLPSTLAAGSYNVTVSYNSATSAPVPVTVVQRRFEVFSRDASGTGLAIVQNYISATQIDYNSFTTGTLSTGYTISPAKPGQTLIAWGTGLGPISGGDNGPAPAFNFAANGVNVQVIVGGESITPAYAGRAPGFSGEDQINFTLPPDVPTGCTVSFQVSVNGALSAPTFISIAPSASASACVSPIFTTAQLQNFDQGQTYTIGGFDLVQITETVPSLGTVKVDSISGGFTQYTGFQLAAVPPVLTSSAATGACQVIPLSGSRSSVVAGGSGTGLDAGVVTLNGPSGSNLTNQALTETSNSYYLTIGEEGLSTPIPGSPNGKLVAGTYTLAGAGGKDVGTFNTSLTLGSPLTITGGLPSVVNRSSNLTINWTGGNATDLVEIVGLAEIISGTGTNTTVTGAEFVCTTTAGPGTFTVPSSILQQLPAVTAAAIAAGTSSGALEVFSTPVPTTTFSAPLTAGGTVPSSFLALIGTGATPAYQ